MAVHPSAKVIRIRIRVNDDVSYTSGCILIELFNYDLTPLTFDLYLAPKLPVLWGCIDI